MNLEGNLNPLVTIVTVVFNGENLIEDTLLSVIEQTYKNIEYIIIDGGSTDKTTEIIRRYKSHIHYWVSEKDLGIYDAMNKGIDAANGEWISFMNAGDKFSSKSCLADIFMFDQRDFTIIYGDVNVVYPHFTRLVKAKSISEIPKGMPFCHQSTLIKKTYHKSHKFNISNSIAADMEFLMSAYRSGLSFNYLPFAISNVMSGGISDAKRIETIKSWRKVSFEYGSSKYLTFYYIFQIVGVYFKTLLKRILPRTAVSKLLKYYSRLR